MTNEIDKTINELAAKMRNKFDLWQLYPTGGQKWCVRGVIGEQVFMETFPGLTEALTAALDWVPMPVIPRRPMRYVKNFMEARKDQWGKKWELWHSGRRVAGCLFKTKKAAMAAAETIVDRSNREADQWEEKYGELALKVDGVDFRYE